MVKYLYQQHGKIELTRALREDIDLIKALQNCKQYHNSSYVIQFIFNEII